MLGEALSNASRHAEASAVEVLSAGDQIVVGERRRQGHPTGVLESGLSNMRERAARRGGTLSVVTSPETGTRLTWSVPARS